MPSGDQPDGTEGAPENSKPSLPAFAALRSAWLVAGRDGLVARATSLHFGIRVQLAEVAFIKLGDGWICLLDCVDHWTRRGAKNAVKDAPRLDEAVDQYLEWLKASHFRDAKKRHWRIRMNVFKNSVANIRVSEVTPETIEKFLAGRNTSPGGKDTDRRAGFLPARHRHSSLCRLRPASAPQRPLRLHHRAGCRSASTYESGVSGHAGSPMGSRGIG